MANNKSETHKQYWLKNEVDKKIDDYSSLIGVTKTGLLVDLIEDFFKDKVVNKEFIVPEKPFHFNMNELLENGTVRASTNAPSREFKKYYTVKKISNNLDSFDAELKSYCYDGNINFHRGIFIYYFLSQEAKPVPLVFDYDVEANEIIISLIRLSELRNFIDTDEDVETIEGIIKDVKYATERYMEVRAKDLDFTDGSKDSQFYIEFITSISEVIEDYEGRKKIDLLVKFKVNEFDSSLADDLDNLEDIPLGATFKTEDIFRLAIENERKYSDLSSEVDGLRADAKKLKEIFEYFEEANSKINWEKVRKEY